MAFGACFVALVKWRCRAEVCGHVHFCRRLYLHENTKTAGNISLCQRLTQLFYSLQMSVPVHKIFEIIADVTTNLWKKPPYNNAWPQCCLFPSSSPSHRFLPLDITPKTINLPDVFKLYYTSSTTCYFEVIWFYPSQPN